MSVLLAVIAAVAAIGALVGYVMLLIKAFRAGVWWGVGFLAALCVPFAFIIIIIFATRNWAEVKVPFLIYLGGGIVASAAIYALPLTMGQDFQSEWNGMVVAQQDDDTEPPVSHPAASPTPPPPPEPSPTIYLPEALLDYTPAPRPVMQRPTVGPDEEFVLTLQNAHQRLGWTMEVTTTDGRVFEGILLAVDERSMTFERRLNTGSMIFPIPTADIRKLELTQ